MYLRFIMFTVPTRPPYFKSDATRHCGSNMAEDELVRTEINMAMSIKVAHAENGGFIESYDADFPNIRRCIIIVQRKFRFEKLPDGLLHYFNNVVKTSSINKYICLRTKTLLYNL